MNNALRAVLSHTPAISAGERALLASITLATTLAPLNSTMIAVALPRIAAEFGAGAVGIGAKTIIARTPVISTLSPRTIAGILMPYRCGMRA